MAMSIKVHEAGKVAKFSYGEELGIKSFLESSHVRYPYPEPTIAKFGYGSDNVSVYPDGTGAGIRVEVSCTSESEKFATPDMQFAVKYGSGRNDADKIMTALCNILDILEYRKSIVDSFKDMNVISG